MVEREAHRDGLTLLFEHVPGVLSTSVGVWLRLGSRHEPRAHSGVSHFVEHLVFKGTATRSARDISLLTDRIGGDIDAFTTKDMICLYARVLDEHLPVAVDLLADLVRRPRFDPTDLERERRVVLEEIRMVQDSPEERLYDLFCERFWPGHALGRPVQGTLNTVAQLDRGTVRRWFRRAFGPPNVLIAAAGRLPASRRALIRRAFAELPAGRPVKNGPGPSWRPGVKFERRAQLEQVHLMLGVPGLPAGDRRRFTLHVLNTLLGGALSSRLFQRVREERGLAYSVASQSLSHIGAGLLTVYAATSPDKADDVLRLALAELRDLASRAPRAEEVDVARDHLKGALILALESTASRMSRAAREEMTLGRCLSAQDIAAQLDAVRPQQIRRLAEELFAGRTAALAAVGRTERLRLRPQELEL